MKEASVSSTYLINLIYNKKKFVSGFLAIEEKTLPCQEPTSFFFLQGWAFSKDFHSEIRPINSQAEIAKCDQSQTNPLMGKESNSVANLFNDIDQHSR